MKFSAFCVVLACLVIFTTERVRAQEAGMSDFETVMEPASPAGSAVFTPGEEIRYSPQAPHYTPATDSVMLQIADFPMQRAAQRPVSDKNREKQKKDDESILTFNFLYYIIQKYKLQDIID